MSSSAARASLMATHAPGNGCRLMYVVGQLSTGGLERQLSFLLQGLDRARYVPLVVVWNYSNADRYVSAIEELGVPVHAMEQQGARKLGELRALVHKLRPEVVHSCTFFTNFPAWFATVGTHTVPIGTVRSDYLFDMKETGLVRGSLCSRWPRNQIYNNFLAAANAKREWRALVPRNTVVVRNGVDPHRFFPTAVPSEGRVCIQCVGSLVPVKRWDRVLHAAVELKRRGLDFIIHVAGDGPMFGPLSAEALRLGVSDCVKFLGVVADIPRLLSQASFLVHTSDAEGCPNSVVEAMSCGRAVIATDAGDVSDLIDDGVTGFVVSPADAESLADRMADLIVNRERCRQMGEAAGIKAAEQFGLPRLVTETLAAYRAAGWMDSPVGN